MKKINIKNIVCLALSFFIPLFVLLIIFINNKFYPFTNNGNTVLMIDAQGQYIAFYRYYKTILSGNVDAIYTMGKSLGGDMMSIFTYYLASPFYLLFALINESQLPLMLLIITILKISTAGITSYIFLKNITKNSISPLIFSISYSLISYNFVYHSNLMWLDCVYILPLVMLGIKQLIDGKKPILYIISLALSLYFSWYIGYMICIFAVLFFVFETLKKINNKNKRDIFTYCLKFLIASLIGGLLSSFTWASAFVHLSGTKGGVDIVKNILDNMQRYFHIINVFRFSTLDGFKGFEDITSNGMHIYVGALSTTLSILYFINKNIKIKDRLLALIPLIVFFLGFLIIGIDTILHGGAQPTWFPFRYAFIFGMYIIYLATISFENIENMHPIRLMFPLVIFVILLLFSKIYIQYTPSLFSFITIIAIIIIFIVNYLFKSIKWMKPLSASLFLIFNTYNMYLNSNNTIEKLADRYLKIDTYNKDESLSEIINNIKKQDSSLFRLEKTFMREGSYNNANNDSMYYGYNGLSHYSSNEKKNVQEYLSRIGFHYNGFWNNYGSGSTLSINSLLGVKYILNSKDNIHNTYINNTSNNSFLNFLNRNNELSSENIGVYDNPYALPYLIIVNSNEKGYVDEGKSVNGETHWFDHFEFQNQIYKTMTSDVKDNDGNQKDIFKKANYTLSTNVKYRETCNGNIYEVLEKNDNINYYVQTDNQYPYYYKFKKNDSYLHYFNQEFNLRINGSGINYFNYYNFGINGLKPTNGTQTITVTALKKMTNRSFIEEFYYEDLFILQEYIDNIKNQKVEEISHNSSKYIFNVNVTKDKQQLLLTLPYEDNFVIKIDGKKVKTFNSYHIFLGANIEKGNHTIEIEYVDKGLKAGLIISSFTLITGILYLIYHDIIFKNFEDLIYKRKHLKDLFKKAD